MLTFCVFILFSESWLILVIRGFGFLDWASYWCGQMTKDNSELFTELSGEEQEIIVGGSSSPGLYDFLFQMTRINTFANTQTTVTSGNSSITSKEQTGYSLTQITLGLGNGQKHIFKNKFAEDFFYQMMYFFLFQV